MGLTINFLDLLENTSKKGINFQKLGVLGRQYLYTDLFELRKKWSKADAELLLNTNGGYADTFYQKKLGAKSIQCFDTSDYEGAEFIHNFNFPIPQNHYQQFDVFLESGSLEHIFNFPCAVANCMNLVKEGGHFIGIMPANNFCGHGFYQFTPELIYRVFSPENGFAIKELILFEDTPFSKKFEIKDPNIMKQRMDFCNSHPVYLYVVAQKTKHKTIFDNIPSQSDYVVAWNNKEYSGSKTAKKIVFKYQILNSIKDWFNKYIRRGSKSVIRNFKRKFNYLGDIPLKFISKK